MISGLLKSTSPLEDEDSAGTITSANVDDIGEVGIEILNFLKQ